MLYDIFEQLMSNVEYSTTVMVSSPEAAFSSEAGVAPPVVPMAMAVI